MNKATYLSVLILIASVNSSFAADWKDEFHSFSLKRWTPQTNRLRFVDARRPSGTIAKAGVLTLLEPQRGLRLTSRDRFLYGTLEARVRISPSGTVWTDKKKLLGAAMDQRRLGKARSTTITIAGKYIPKNQSWRMTRLSARVQPIKNHGWKVTNQVKSGLILQGPLRPGEMLLLESSK